MKRIVYIQHAGALGGSVVSLGLLAQSLDRQKFEPIIACIHPTQMVLDYYQKLGLEAIYWPGIKDFMHTTGGWYALYNPQHLFKLANRIVTYQASVKATEALIQHFAPDLLHLNSLVLPSSAEAAHRCHVKLVWHIRESVVQGHFSLRKQWLGHQVKHLADEAIFISADGRRLLVADKKGVVIPNFVDFELFDQHLDGSGLRESLQLPPDSRVILFLGGRSIIKGIIPLLEALPQVKQSLPNAHLLVAYGAYHFSGRLSSRIARSVLPLIGSGTVAQRVDKLIQKHQLQDCVHMLEWRADVPQLMAASDVVVFPSTAPHFARPVIEAGAMAKPVVASRIGGVEELVVDGQTGLLVPPNDPDALADALIRVLQAPDFARKMGVNGLKQARQRFNTATNIQATMQVYEQVLDKA